MGEALLPIINPTVREKYGLEISSFILENVSVPAEVEQAIDKQSSMRAIGNLNDYVKYQMGLSMGQGGEGGAAAAMPAQMAMGFAMAQDMMRGMGTKSLPRPRKSAFGAPACSDPAGLSRATGFLSRVPAGCTWKASSKSWSANFQERPMLYNLLYGFHTEWSWLNVFRYITLRSIGSAITAFLVVAFCGPAFIRWLRSRQIGQVVRDDGPETHWSKRGVPTMGGLLVLAGMGAAVLLWCDLRNGLVWLLLAISVFYAGIGAII